MYGQHVAPQTHNKRTGLSIRDVKRHADARIAAFGVSILVAGLLLLPCAALATEMPETDVAAPITCDEANAEGSLTATTVVDHNYDLELPPAFMLVQNEAFVYDFPDKPEDFIYGLNDTGYADDQIPYRLNLNSSAHLGTHVDRDFDSGQGIMHETRHDYYIRYVFDSDVHLIATDVTDPEPSPAVKPNPEVKPEPETQPEPTPQPKAEKPAANPVSTKAVAAVKPAGTTLPATGDNGAMAVALSVAGGVVVAVGISATRRRNH